MYHNPHIKSTQRNGEYSLKGDVDSTQHDSAIISNPLRPVPQYEPSPASTPPIIPPTLRNQYDASTPPSQNNQSQNSGQQQYINLNNQALQQQQTMSSTSSAALVLSNSRQQQQKQQQPISAVSSPLQQYVLDTTPPPVPVSSSRLSSSYDKPLISTTRSAYRPTGFKHRPRPASVHEQDFLKGALFIKGSGSVGGGGDPLDKSSASRRSNTRPLSLHEQQHLQPADQQNSQISPQYPRSYNIGHISSKPTPIAAVTSLSQSQEKKAMPKLKQDFKNNSTNSSQNDGELLQDELYSNSKTQQQKIIDAHKQRMKKSEDGGGVPLVMERVRDRGGLSKDYDYLYTQCEQAMRDVQDLKKQQVETARKHDMAVKECEMMRINYKATKDKNETLVNEVSRVRVQCHEYRAEKERFRREVEDLQKLKEEDKAELGEMRKQQRKLISEGGSSEVLNMFDATIGKYESLKQEFDTMRRNYADNLTILSASDSKVELLQDEVKRSQDGRDELRQENNQLQQTQKGLEKHFTSMIQKSQNEVSSLKQEISTYKSALQLHDTQDKLIKDMGKFKKERDAVLHEYSLVMEERNTVYKEIEELEEKLSSSQKQLEGSVKDNKTMSDHLETLKREIDSALQDRDHAMKELNELKEKYSSTLVGIKHEAEKRIERERERSSRDGSDASTKDIATAREIDSLKREVERVKAELIDTQKEVVLAKNRRDWVFSERDKIVRERESIRTLCDKLRRERDSAVTQFMEAVKDSDELKTSKTEALRQLKELQEKYDTLLEKVEKENGERLNDIEGYNRSTDSAIDADLTEWHVDTKHINLGSNTEELGFDLGHGRDENSVVVTSVRPGTVAFDRLRVNDIVVKVNNVDVNNINYKDILEGARHSGTNIVSVAVKKKKPVGCHGIKPVIIRLSDIERDAGIQIASGMYVSVINQGSPAAMEGSLAVGDRILSVNGNSVDNMSICEIVKLIRESEEHVSLNILKFPSSPSLFSTSPSSSGQMLSDVGSPDRGCSSPTVNLWHLASSPDSASKVQVGGAGTALRSSGSQTDSLDSPPISARSRNTNRGGGLYMKSPSSDKPVNQNSSKDSLLNRAFKKITKAANPFQTDRNEKCRSMYSRDDDSDQAAIAELHSIVNQYSQQQEDSSSMQQHQAKSSKSNKRRFMKEIHSGGTWPRYKPSVDEADSENNNTNIEGFQPVIPSRRPKLRPALDEILYHHTTNSANSNNSAVEPNPFGSSSGGNSISRVPPTPPERNDSFKRSASVNVKHSPQSSDSTVKSSHSQSHTTTSSPAKVFQQSVQSSSASGVQQKSYDVFPPSVISQQGSLPRKIGTLLGVGSVGGEPSQLSNSSYDDYSGVNSNNSAYNNHPIYPGSSSTDSANTSQDFTVVSGDIRGYKRSARPRNRPRTAPSRNRDNDYHHQSSDVLKNSINEDGSNNVVTSGGAKSGFKTTAVKPSYIDIHPVYPTRPPPPHAAGGAQSSSSSYQSPLGSGPPNSAHLQHSNHHGGVGAGGGSGSNNGGGGSNGKPPIGHFTHIQSTRHPPPPVPHHHYTGTSQQFQTSSPINIGPPPPQGFSPPPAYGSYNRHSRLNTPSPSPSQQSNLTYDNSGTNSEGEFQYGRNGIPIRSPFIPGSSTENHHSHPEGIATLPRRSQYKERIRIPSNNSMFSSTQSSVSKISTNSSIERMSLSDRASPISPFMHIPPGSMADYACLTPSSSNSLPKSGSDNKNIVRPQAGATRSITIEKGSDRQLGITIDTGRKGVGVFVSSISVHSLASKAGLCVGDQLLEVCGINMRKATRDQVATVLTQVGTSITVLVQYNPENLKGSEYHHDNESDSSSTTDSSSDTDDDDDDDETNNNDNEDTEPEGTDHVRTGSQRSTSQSHASQRSGGSSGGRSGSGRSSIRRHPPLHAPPSVGPPPPPVPQPPQQQVSPQTGMDVGGVGGSGGMVLGSSLVAAVSASEVPTSMSPVHARTKGDDSVYAGQLRFVFYKRCNPEDHVGFEMVGGNAVGIFVDRVHPSGPVPSGPSGLNTGDQILEFNGVSFRDLTFEQALLEVSKPSDSVTIRAQYNYAKYKKAESQHGDSLFIKALFDYTPDKEGELNFNRDDILYVESTVYNSAVQGVWRAWLLDEHGAKAQCGTVPSKNKLEDEYALRRSISDIGEDELKGGSSRRGSMSANRRSFFRRKKHHRNNSKDSRELSSFSDASINSDYDDGCMWTYERVERLDNKVWRPVMILGPLAESLIDKLASESPDKYCRCLPQRVQTSISTIQAGQRDGVFIEFKARSDGQFECITVDSIKTIMGNNRHCMLNIEPEAIEILHKVHIYPIVLFIKHESHKHIREFRDSRFLPDKMSSKKAKELFQQFKEHEHNYKRYFADVIQGDSLAQLGMKIKNDIDKEQKKTLWVPSGVL